MLELSLQPNSLEQSSDSTTYTWEYKRLVQARPIAIDVLGIAALDRLGELTWLGPLSVLVFGILIALIARDYATFPIAVRPRLFGFTAFPTQGLSSRRR